MTKAKRFLLTLFILSSVVELSHAADPKSTDKGAEKPAEPTAPSPELTTYEYICISEVSYSWKTISKQGNRPPTPPEPKTVLFSKAYASDSTEEGSRSKLGHFVIKYKQAALADCKQKHEDTSLCTASRLKLISHAYNISDFQTRSSLRDTVEKDCARQAGECLAITSSEASCIKIEKEQVTNQSAAAPATKAEEENKAAKKK